MNDKQVLFAVNTYLYKYLDCDLNKWGNLKGDIKSQINKYTKLGDMYEGLEPNLYSYAMYLLEDSTSNLVDRLFTYFESCYGENLYTKLLEEILNSLYKD